MIATGGGRRAVLGELFATEAVRRGLAGIVIDGLLPRPRGHPRARAPGVRARHVPGVRLDVSRAAPGGRRCAAAASTSSPGDIVFGDDDGIVIAPPERIAAALETAEAGRAPSGRSWRGIRRGEPLHDLTNYAEHVAGSTAASRATWRSGS